MIVHVDDDRLQPGVELHESTFPPSPIRDTLLMKTVCVVVPSGGVPIEIF